MRNLQRRLRKLEAGILDSHGLIPHTPEWLEFWNEKLDRLAAGEDVDLSGRSRRSGRGRSERTATAMKIIESRLRKLEDQLGTGDGKPRLLLVVCKAGWGLALDVDTCVQILDECGSLPTGPVGLVSNWETNLSKPSLQLMPAIVRFLGYNPVPPGSGWAERLVHCRTILGFSQKESAKQLGVDASTLARWERGEREPAGAFLARVTRFLDEAEADWSDEATKTA